MEEEKNSPDTGKNSMPEDVECSMPSARPVESEFLQETVPVTEETPEEKRKNAKRKFSRAGWFLSVYYVLSMGLVTAAAILFYDAFSQSGTFSYWLVNLAPMYLIALPAAWLILRPWKPEKNFGKKMPVGEWLIMVSITFFFMMAGNLLGLGVTMAVNSLTGTPYSNAVDNIAVGNLGLQILFVVIAAPLAEELIFRKLLISRLRVYGEKTAILFSAIVFGLYHGNIQQAFYAFTLGLVFGYVYNRTGKLIYSAGLHMAVNLLSGVVPSFFLSGVSDSVWNMIEESDVEGLVSVFTAAPSDVLSLAGYACCIFFEFALAALGIVFFCIRVRDLSFSPVPEELQKKKFSTVFLNAGTLAFVLAAVAVGIFTYGSI